MIYLVLKCTAGKLKDHEAQAEAVARQLNLHVCVCDASGSAFVAAPQRVNDADVHAIFKAEGRAYNPQMLAPEG